MRASRVERPYGLAPVALAACDNVEQPGSYAINAMCYTSSEIDDTASAAWVVAVLAVAGAAF